MKKKKSLPPPPPPPPEDNSDICWENGKPVPKDYDKWSWYKKLFYLKRDF